MKEPKLKGFKVRKCGCGSKMILESFVVTREIVYLFLVCTRGHEKKLEIKTGNEEFRPRMDSSLVESSP